MSYRERILLQIVRWAMGRFNSLRRTMGGFMPPLFDEPPSPDPVVLRNESRDEGVADDLRHIEILGRLILRTIHKLEKQMADRNYTTQEILDLVRAQRGEIASLSAAMGAIKSRLNAALAGEISPKGQAILNDIMSEVQGNSRAMAGAVLNNDDDPTNDVDADGNPLGGHVNVSGSGQGNQIGGGALVNGSDDTATNSEKAATTTTLSTSNPVAAHGEEVTLSAAVSAEEGVDKPVEGVVRFATDQGAIGQATVDGNGIATLPTTVPAGDHEITATFTGNDTFATSSSDPITQSAMPKDEPAPDAPATEVPPAAPASPGVAATPAA